jgi:uncharacterized SAM-binding protein YcdF (DUF218 family)
MLTELKPYLTALIMPPMSLIALILLGSWLNTSKKYKAKGKGLVVLSTLLLAALSSNPVALWLNDQLLPSSTLLDMKTVNSFQAGAIVILGGGVEAPSTNGEAQLQTTTLDRLRYGVYLHRKTALPMLFSGGLGFGAKSDFESEAMVTQRVAKEVFGVEVKWLEGQSRDTQENASNSYQLLKEQGITKIILVTHSWHMPRSLEQFKNVGFDVLPAPMGPLGSNNESTLSWIPSADGLRKTTVVLREALAIKVMQIKIYLK